MQNKGYYDINKFPFGNPETPRSEELTVICNFCNATWREEMPSRANIAGYAKRYDFCNLCEQHYFAAKDRINTWKHPSNTDPQPDKYTNKFRPPKWANQKLGLGNELKPNYIERFIDEPFNKTEI